MVRTRQRPAAPVELVRSKAAWTKRLERISGARTAGDWATPKAKRILKRPLLALTHGKCVFCEGRLGAQAYPQIEHYVSRRVNPGRAFEWDNLLPVCQVCNDSKGFEDHQGRLLKPDAEDPEPFFWIGPEGDIAPHPRLNEAEELRAAETIRLCHLKRGELRDDRQTVATRVRRWLARASELVNGSDELAKEEWDEISHPRQIHKFIVRQILTRGNAPELAAMDRERFQQWR